MPYPLNPETPHALPSKPCTPLSPVLSTDPAPHLSPSSLDLTTSPGCLPPTLPCPAAPCCAVSRMRTWWMTHTKGISSLPTMQARCRHAGLHACLRSHTHKALCQNHTAKTQQSSSTQHKHIHTTSPHLTCVPAASPARMCVPSASPALTCVPAASPMCLQHHPPSYVCLQHHLPTCVCLQYHLPSHVCLQHHLPSHVCAYPPAYPPACLLPLLPTLCCLLLPCRLHQDV